MSNYFEYNGKIAFHPGYYLEETVASSGLNQRDFAKRLDVSPKTLSCIIDAKQSLTAEVAVKLSKLLDTSAEFWLNLQSKYDTQCIEANSQKEIEDEREVFEYIDYNYFVNNCGFERYYRQVDKQIEAVRKKLGVATLNVLKERDLAVNFRSSYASPSISNTINSNVMVQIAINKALEQNIPKYNKKRFEEAVSNALTLTERHDDFLPLIQKSFFDAGVMFIVIPHLKNSGINGATKKLGESYMIMVNDRRNFSDTFWFSLYHEIGHIMNRNMNDEDKADEYARDALMPKEEYEKFRTKNHFSEDDIRRFAKRIKRDPGIVLGRLQNDGIIEHKDQKLNRALKHKYHVVCNI